MCSSRTGERAWVWIPGSANQQGWNKGCRWQRPSLENMSFSPASRGHVGISLCSNLSTAWYMEEGSQSMFEEWTNEWISHSWEGLVRNYLLSMALPGNNTKSIYADVIRSISGSKYLIFRQFLKSKNYKVLEPGSHGPPSESSWLHPRANMIRWRTLQHVSPSPLHDFPISKKYTHTHPGAYLCTDYL